MAASVAESLQELCADTKLRRDRAEAQLQQLLADDADSLPAVRAWIDDQRRQLQERSSAGWEPRFGLMRASQLLLRRAPDAELLRSVFDSAVPLLADSEFRVRVASGDCLGQLCAADSSAEYYSRLRPLIFAGVRENLERTFADEADECNDEQRRRLQEKLNDKEAIFHDTAGWKFLETWMRCLLSVVEGYGDRFGDLVDEELLELVFTTLAHTNRFVRETGFQVLAAVARTAGTQHQPAIAQQLAAGLSDNWSQVRMAASAAARTFLQKYIAEGQLPPAGVQRLLVPALCLNRYYVAEGVRLHNQETWRQLTALHDGRQLVAANMRAVAEFYVSQSRADNHAVREAACACVAELGAKVDAAAVRPFLPQLLEALLVCFEDDSWPVRDAACLACGRFAVAFPEPSAAFLPRLLPLCFANLQDNVASVRHGAAASLRGIAGAMATSDSLRDSLLQRLAEGLAQAARQPEHSSSVSGLSSQPAVYSVAAKRQRDNDAELHTNQTMYSCGSLAPKMARGGGCSDHRFRRPAEPWELADGSVHLLRELSDLRHLQQQLLEQLPALAEALRQRHFAHHVVLLESGMRCLPTLAANFGKAAFKRHLQLFLEPMAYALGCDSNLAAAAAEDCVRTVARLVGPGILRGRVEQFDPALLPAFEPLLL